VEELWYGLGGTGEIWRRRDGEPSRVDDVKAGDSVRIPVGVSFQFRASQHANLELLLATMPPWPGVQEEAVGTSGGIDEDRS
jgi:mannose-6-phosphate isomerase-like protein (cupin superfamily)